MRQNGIDLKATLAITGMFVAVLVLWNTPVVYPVKVFVVCLHELGHALAALLTGGQVESILVFPDQGGVTITRGGVRFIILSAGYTGSVLAGGVLLYLSSYRQWARVLMMGLAVLMLLSTVLFFRNLFGIVYGLVVTGAMLFSAFRLPDTLNYYVLRFVAVASCLYALLDIRSDLFGTYSVNPTYGVVNDAVALAQLTHIPAIIWALVWLVVSFAMLAFFLNLSARVHAHRDAKDKV